MINNKVTSLSKHFFSRNRKLPWWFSLKYIIISDGGDFPWIIAIALVFFFPFLLVLSLLHIHSASESEIPNLEPKLVRLASNLTFYRKKNPDLSHFVPIWPTLGPTVRPEAINEAEVYGYIPPLNCWWIIDLLSGGCTPTETFYHGTIYTHFLYQNPMDLIQQLILTQGLETYG